MPATLPVRESPAAPTTRIEATAAEVAQKLSTFLAGVPAETREMAIDAYRRITLELLTTRGLPPEQANPLIETIVQDIRFRVAAVERAGGTVAGRA